MDDHRIIEKISGNIIRIISEDVPDIEEILSARLELSAEIRAHWALEDELLRIWSISDHGKDSFHYVKGLFEEYRAFRAEWDDYLYEWGAESIAADWAYFCAQTRKIIKRLQDKSASENVYIYPLALRIGIISRSGQSVPPRD